MTIHLNCTNCSAPIEASGTTATVRCTYCDSVVVVPEALRPPQTRSQSNAAPAPKTSSTRQSPAPEPNALGRVPSASRGARPAAGSPFMLTSRRRGGIGGCLMVIFYVALFVLVTTTIFGQWWRQPLATLGIWPLSGEQSLPSATVDGRMPAADRLPSIVNQIAPALAPVLAPTAVPTPGFATEVARFGSEGIAPGYFDDARAIALDNQGRLYVGEYSSGRVQVFDESGTFRSQWSFPEDSYVRSFAVDRQANLYASIGQELLRHDAQTGAVLGSLSDWSDEWADNGVAIAPDGRIVFELGDDLVRLGVDGAADLIIADAIEAASGDPEISTLLAVDGLGNIFAIAISQDVVYKFGPDGRYLNRFGERDWKGVTGEGLFSAAGSIAIDPQGRVYIGDFDGIQVFDNNGRYLDLIEVDGYPSGLVFNDAGALFVVARDKVIQYRINDLE